MVTQTYYQVAPRFSGFSGGSPAQVDQETAERVANDERMLFEGAADGSCGEALKRLAQTKGLAGIVEQVTEDPNGVVTVRDLLTGEVRLVGRQGKRPTPEGRREDLAILRDLVIRRGSIWVRHWVTYMTALECQAPGYRKLAPLDPRD